MIELRRVLARFIVVAIWLGVASAAAVPGLSYYLLPVAERPYSELHDLYRSSGLVGHGFGILGSFMMLLGVITYSSRKRMTSLSGAGGLQGWLRFHIFLCTLGPFLVLLHTTFRFGGIVAISFWSMTLVTVSGIFGRYVYTRIPRSINGQFISLKRLQEQCESLVERIRGVAEFNVAEVAAALGIETRVPASGLVSALGAAVTYDFRRRRMVPRLRRELKDRDVPFEAHDAIVELMQQQVRLQHQLVILAPFQRLFRYWHVFHLPMAILMLLIMILHVGIAVMFGYSWIW